MTEIPNPRVGLPEEQLVTASEREPPLGLSAQLID